MKKLIFFISAAMIFISCTRASNSENARIQIKLPDLATSYSGKVGTLSEPSQLADLNCYMVFVGGPEQDLQRNTCPTLGSSANGTPGRTINFGPLYGGFSPSTEISIEVPSGNDRVLHLVGMRVSSPEICRDFKAFGFPGKNESSKPFIIGTADRVLLEPSKTVEVPIKMAFNAADAIEKCTGPDVPQDSGGGGNSNEPYLRFEGLGKWSYPANKDLGTVGQCYQVKPALYINGSAWVDPGMSVIDINVSAFNAGQFYSDSGCSTSISSLQIPAGQSKSSTNYYFKTNNPAADVTLSGYTVSGNSLSLQNSMQLVDFGYPKLSFIGPDKLPQGLCAKYRIVSEYYEGGPLSVTGGGLNISLTDNASFYLRAYPDCSTGTSATITTATSETEVYLKINSPATSVSFNSQATAPMYNTSNYSVQTSLRNNHVDSIQVLAKDNKIFRGSCNPITVRLVNADGGAATAKNNMNLFIKAPQGSGSFYTLPNCSGAPINNFPLISGNYELNIGFKANSLPLASLVTGKIPIQLHFGSIRLQNSLFSGPSEILFDVADQYDPWFISAMPPSFNGAEIVGTHEFNDGGSPNTFKYIPLLGNYTDIASVECSATPGTGYSPCSAAELDNSSIPYKYKWASSNAAASVARYVRFNYTNSGGGSGNREIKISGDVLYGSNFKVLQCDTLVPANTAIESMTGSGVLCLPANSIHSRSSATAFTLTSTRTSLIGHSSMTSELQGASQSANIFYSSATNIPTSSFFVANLKFRNITSSMPAIGFSNPVATVTMTGEFNNIDIYDSGTASTTNFIDIANNDPDLTLKFRNIKLAASGANNIGIYIHDSSNISLENSDLDVPSALYGINITNTSGSGSSIKITNTSVKTTIGPALYFSNSTAANGNGIEITNSRFHMTGSGNASTAVVKITNKINNLYFDNNIIDADPGTPNLDLLHLFSSAPSDFTAFMRTNTFTQGYFGSTVIGIEGGYDMNITDFSDNSMATTALVNNNANGMFNIFAATTLNIWTNISVPANGGNLACSNNPSYIFTTPLTNNGTIGGGLGIAGISTIMNNMSLTSKRCSGL